MSEMTLRDARHRNRSADADPLVWCQWLAMDLGALANDDARELMLLECHMPGKFVDRLVRIDATGRCEPVERGAP